MLDNEHYRTGAIIVAVRTGTNQEAAIELEELTNLLKTLDIPTHGQLIQNQSALNPAYLLGTGKINEIEELINNTGARLVVVDQCLSGVQQRNLESRLHVSVIDKSGLIIEIFSRNARTDQAQTQVEVARLEYLLPKLTGYWSHFGRQTGGGVRSRGMGEKQLEIDRRRARARLSQLQKKLAKIESCRSLQRESRRNQFKVALVGYTNSGKTTVMHGLTRLNQKGENKLFATLDARVKVLDPGSRPTILLSDTVGFIRNLPHGLVESFKATLNEVAFADLVVQVVDISDPNFRDHMQVTEQVLAEIGAGEIPQLLVFNKVDQLDEPFLSRIVGKQFPGSLAISALDRDGLDQLRPRIINHFLAKFEEAKVAVMSENNRALAEIYRSCVILDSDYSEPGSVCFTVKASPETLRRIDSLKH